MSSYKLPAAYTMSYLTRGYAIDNLLNLDKDEIVARIGRIDEKIKKLCDTTNSKTLDGVALSRVERSDIKKCIMDLTYQKKLLNRQLTKLVKHDKGVRGAIKNKKPNELALAGV